MTNRAATVSFHSDVIPSELILSLRSYADPVQLSALLTSKVRPQVLTVESRVTAECQLQNGCAFGLENGCVVIYEPPCSLTVAVLKGKEVVAVVEVNEKLYVFGESGYSKVKINTGEVEVGEQLTAGITTAAKGLGEDQILVGFSSGVIEDYQEAHGHLTKTTSYSSPGSVQSIHTLPSETWFLALYTDTSHLCSIWRYGASQPLYQFNRNYEVVMTPVTVETVTQIPMKEYGVVMDRGKIVFVNTKEKTQTFGVKVGKAGVLTVEEDMSLMDYLYFGVKSENQVVFHYQSFCLLLSPSSQATQQSWVTRVLSTDESVSSNFLRLNIGCEYERSVTSTDGLHVFLICENEIRAVFLAAIDLPCMKTFNVNDSEIGENEVLHKRFGRLFSGDGKEISALDGNRNYVFSPDKELVSTYAKDETDWKLEEVRTGRVRCESREVPEVVFSGFDNSVVLVYRATVTILNPDNPPSSLPISIPNPHLDTTSFYFRPSHLLFTFHLPSTLSIYSLLPSPSPRSFSILNFERIDEIDPSKPDFLITFRDKTAYFSFENGNFTHKTDYPGTYLSLKPFAAGNYCLGVTERRYNILNLPDLEVIMTFDMDVRVIIDRFSHTFCTYGIDGNEENYLCLTYWDLELGLPIHTFDFGFNKIPSSFPPVSPFPTSQPYLLIWKLPFKFPSKEFLSLETLYGAEYFPSYCLSLYRLAGLLSSSKPSLKDIPLNVMLYPQKVNVLHLLTYLQQPKLVYSALVGGGKVVKSVYGTPISICLKTVQKPVELDQCLDSLLDGLIKLSENNSIEFIVALQGIDEDLPGLLRSESTFLPSFLQTILVPLPSQFSYKHKVNIGARLPLCDVWTDVKPHYPRWRFEQLWTWPRDAMPVLRVCPIPMKMDLRRDQLLGVLMRTDPKKGVLSQEVFASLAQAKWREIHLPMKFLSLLFWVFLILLICRLYDYGPQSNLQIALFVLNSVLLIIEIWQIITGDRKDYARNMWNWVDFLRSAFTFAWIGAEKRLWLNFVMVVLNALIGLTTFEAFEFTRSLVRMIMKVCYHTLYFVIIFIYSNLAFGVLCAVSDEDAGLNFYESWTTGFEISMGGFDNSGVPRLRWFVFFFACLVNMVWLLNLIVALLGTAYENFITDLAAEDIQAQYEQIYQLESMVKWVSRKDRQTYYLHVYDYRKHSSNPRDENVTLQLLREELEELKQDVKSLLSREASANR